MPRENRPLAGRAAVVTGAGRGIGAACALAFADAGADVALVARTRSQLEAVAAQVEKRGRHAWVAPCDVTDPVAVDRTFASFERVEILVNNAGWDAPMAFLDVTPEVLEQLLAVNVKGTFYCAQAAARRMIGGGGGAIVNMASQLGLVGSEYETAYCAAKFGVVGLTRALAKELAPHEIRVNCLAPTVVETPLTAPGLADDAMRQIILDLIPLRRFAEPEDVAAAAVFLASPAARMITGATLPVDGGWVA